MAHHRDVGLEDRHMSAAGLYHAPHPRSTGQVDRPRRSSRRFLKEAVEGGNLVSAVKF